MYRKPKGKYSCLPLREMPGRTKPRCVTCSRRSSTNPTQECGVGDLLIMSDIDEIPSRQALMLAKTCVTPSWLHLTMKNYMYSFEFPLNDHGYWRASIVTASSNLQYSHTRQSDDSLLSAGWHCSWCFRTLEEFRIKMKVKRNPSKQGKALFFVSPLDLVAFTS